MSNLNYKDINDPNQKTKEVAKGKEKPQTKNYATDKDFNDIREAINSKSDKQLEYNVDFNADGSSDIPALWTLTDDDDFINITWNGGSISGNIIGNATSATSELIVKGIFTDPNDKQWFAKATLKPNGAEFDFVIDKELPENIQSKTDNSLKTTSKDITGAINEISEYDKRIKIISDSKQNRGIFPILEDAKTQLTNLKDGDFILVGTGDPYQQYKYDAIKNKWILGEVFLLASLAQLREIEDNSHLAHKNADDIKSNVKDIIKNSNNITKVNKEITNNYIATEDNKKELAKKLDINSLNESELVQGDNFTPNDNIDLLGWDADGKKVKKQLSSDPTKVDINLKNIPVADTISNGDQALLIKQPDQSFKLKKFTDDGVTEKELNDKLSLKVDTNSSPIHIGANSSFTNQGKDGIAIGDYTALNNQGDYAIAIGHGSGYNNQHTKTILMNSSGGQQLNSTQSDQIIIKAGAAELEVTYGKGLLINDKEMARAGLDNVPKEAGISVGDEVVMKLLPNGTFKMVKIDKKGLFVKNDYFDMNSELLTKNDKTSSLHSYLGKYHKGKQLYGFLASGPQSYGENAVGPQSYGENAAGPQSYGENAVGPQSYGENAGDTQTYGENAVGPQTYGFLAAGPQYYGYHSTGKREDYWSEGGVKNQISFKTGKEGKMYLWKNNKPIKKMEDM